MLFVYKKKKNRLIEFRVNYESETLSSVMVVSKGFQSSSR